MTLDWEAFIAAHELVIEAGVALVNDTSEVAAAQAVFFRRTGVPFADEPSFERRLNAFFEWFVLDRPSVALGQTPLAALLAASGRVAEAARCLEHNAVVVATVRKVAGGELWLDRWATKEKKLVAEVGHSAGIAKGDVLFGRLFFCGDRCFVSPSSELLPPDVGKLLRQTLKRKGGDEVEMWTAIMMFDLLRERYAKAATHELFERWRTSLCETKEAFDA